MFKRRHHDNDSCPSIPTLWQKKKNRKEEETPRLSCKKGDNKHGNNSERKRVFFEKKGEYVKRRKEKGRERLIKSKRISIKEIHSKKTKERNNEKTDIQEREQKMENAQKHWRKHTTFLKR